jgi:hypothetical protein
VAVSDESNQDAVATPGASNTGAAPTNAAAVDDAASSSVPDAEREAAMNLMAFAHSNQDVVDMTSERVGTLIQQMTEIQHLRSLQDLIDRRIQALNPGAVPSNN